MKKQDYDLLVSQVKRLPRLRIHVGMDEMYEMDRTY